jgi:competence protein ComEC
MSLAAGGIFWLVRALLALSPTLALQHPIKKWAALAALAGGFIYMLLAGSAAATQRSYIMIAIMLFAVLVDRSAISLRNLAVAAIIILLLQPESAVEASFQMSFMAVMGLAAFFEWWTNRLRDPLAPERGWLGRGLRWLALATVASVLTSLIAGSLSAIPAAFHFGRAAPYGVLANGLAIPIVSLIVMPAALAALIAMPFGMEQWPLTLMGFGLNRVLAISDWVAGLPGSQLVLPQLSALAVLLLAAAAVVLCLAERRHKTWSIALLLAGLLAAKLTAFPDLFIEHTASNVALRNDSGELVFAQVRKGSFAARRWLLANGESATFAEAARRPGWSCSGGICRAVIKGLRTVYAAEESARLPDCATIDILVSAAPLRGRCRTVALRIDRFAVWRNGAYSVQIKDGKPQVSNASGIAGQRPWVLVPTARAGRKE